MTKFHAFAGMPSRELAPVFPPKYRRAGLPVGGTPKRALDIVLTVLGILALAPLLLGFALLVRLSSVGPVFYGHERVGFDGRTFRCWKFRSMVTNGDEVLSAYLASNPAARLEWEQSRKLRDDPRITPVGKVLRKLSIDELPQLFNVLAGEMSLVGPRPVVEDELERYGLSRRHYLKTRPGLTGLWQVSGRSDIDYGRRVALDRSYVSRWSAAQDLKIIAKTIPAVIKSRGSY